MAGCIQIAIRDYLRGVDEATNRQVLAAVDIAGLRTSQECVNTALCRSVRQGWLVRLGTGVYRLAGADRARSEQLIVAGALEKLESTFGPALARELERRGWRR